METNRPTTKAAEEILNKYFPVLDHGFVGLLDYSGTDQCIERAARVSYGAGTRKMNQTRGLLRYLRRHKHTSPSELVNLKFHMCAPIFVLRQFFRHRTISANEYSGRYSLMPMLFYTPDKDNFQKQSKTNNQGRCNEIDEMQYQTAIYQWNKIRSETASLYEDLTAADVARELARIDLPLSTYSQLYFTINLHNLFHFLTLRIDSHAQYEIRVYAEIIAGMLKRVAPLSYEAWIDYDVCGASFSRMELDTLRDIIKSSEEPGHLNIFSLTDVIGIPANGEHGLSKRELTELHKKLVPKEKPDLELDLSQAKSPEYFQEKMLAAVPEVDNTVSDD